MSSIQKNNLEKLEKLDLNQPFFNFRGCTEAVYPGTQYAFRKICALTGIKLVESNDQTCCSGHFLLFNLTTSMGATAIEQRNLNIAKRYSNWMITLCNGCFSSFMLGYDFLQRDPELREKVKAAMQTIGMELVSSKEVYILQAGEFMYRLRHFIKNVIKRDLNRSRIAVQYGCHYLNAHPDNIISDPENPHFVEEMIQILGGVPVEYQEKTLCCGSGVTQRKVHPNASLMIGYEKMKSIRANNPDLIVTICTYCEMEMDNNQLEFAIEYSDDFHIPVLHLAELIGLLIGLDPEKELHMSSHKTSVQSFIDKLKPLPKE
ncbi:MAG: disulfide reductase [Promethearchaeota archaeon CR_4]|nr:MAG: disulfide reductase [Candidatus Lokiarchaeota archaeon CR_4]